MDKVLKQNDKELANYHKELDERRKQLKIDEMK